MECIAHRPRSRAAGLQLAYETIKVNSRPPARDKGRRVKL